MKKQRATDPGAATKYVSGPIMKRHIWFRDLEHERARINRVLRQQKPTEEDFLSYMAQRPWYSPLVTALNWVRKFKGTPAHYHLAAEQVKAWLERNPHLTKRVKVKH